jgi:hypothetical protein
LSDFANGDAYLATVAQLFEADGDSATVELLATASARFEWYSHDNWDGGFDIFNLYLDTPLSLYFRIQDRKDELEEAILKRLQVLSQAHTVDHIQSVTVAVEVVDEPGWKERAQAWTRSVAGTQVANFNRVPVIGGSILCNPEVFKRPDRLPSAEEVSVMMPFAAEFSSTYAAIKRACDRLGLQARRADDIWRSSTFMQDIFELIYCARVVVVDFSGRNPNVLYETGVAHTLGRQVVPITRNLEDVPSDLRHHRALAYLPNEEGLTALEHSLTLRLGTLTGREPSRAG